MIEPPARPERALPNGVAIVHAVAPTVSFYRYLYDTVGERWSWTDRRKMDDASIRAVIQNPRVAIYVLYAQGTPAGYVELDFRTEPDAQIAYFGLLPEFLGKGLGGILLDFGIRAAWQRHPRRVWVHTCTLDHPRALPLYISKGFIRYREEHKPHPG